MIGKILHHRQNRREFLTSLGRYAILGGLLSATGFLIMNRKSASKEGKSPGGNVCRSCVFLKRCRQPRALSVKEEMAG